MYLTAIEIQSVRGYLEENMYKFLIPTSLACVFGL